MGDRWGPGGPPAEAYSRVTDPQPYQDEGLRGRHAWQPWTGPAVARPLS